MQINKNNITKILSDIVKDRFEQFNFEKEFYKEPFHVQVLAYLDFRKNDEGIKAEDREKDKLALYYCYPKEFAELTEKQKKVIDAFSKSEVINKSKKYIKYKDRADVHEKFEKFVRIHQIEEESFYEKALQFLRWRKSTDVTVATLVRDLHGLFILYPEDEKTLTFQDKKNLRKSINDG